MAFGMQRMVNLKKKKTFLVTFLGHVEMANCMNGGFLKLSFWDH